MDLADAYLLFEGQHVISQDMRRDYGEVRWRSAQTPTGRNIHDARRHVPCLQFQKGR
jgi:hypothetical protein